MKRSLKANLRRMERVGERLQKSNINYVKGTPESKLSNLIEKAKKEGIRG
jgi:hypothetical protein